MPKEARIKPYLRFDEVQPCITALYPNGQICTYESKHLIAQADNHLTAQLMHIGAGWLAHISRLFSEY